MNGTTASTPPTQRVRARVGCPGWALALALALALLAGGARWAPPAGAATNGTVVAWGCGSGSDGGQCTMPPGLGGVVAVAAGGTHSLALRADGTVVAWGDNFYGQSSVPPGLGGVVAIAAGSFHSLALTRQPQAIAFGPLGGKTYGDAPFAVSATGGASGNPVTFVTTTPAVCTAGGTDGATLTLVGAGTCAVTADQAGNTFYAAAPTVTQSFTVAPAALTVTADNQTRAYGAADPPFTGTLTGVVNGDVIIVTYSAPATATTGVGDYPIYPEALDSGSTLANYAVTIVAGTLTITPAPLTVTAADQTMALHGAVPPLTVGYQGFVNGETAAALTASPTCATTATSASPVGSYPITCGGAADPNYTIAYRAGALRVVYGFGGFAAPLGGTQTPVFQAGSTIPLKLQLTDASGAVVQASSAPTFSVSAATACGGGAVDASGTTAPGDTGDAFRWDATAQQYIYNDHTAKALAGMCQTLTVTLDDGTTHSVVVAFK